MSVTNQRVFLMDGQAVYLEGDGEITEEVLQQALAQLARQGQTVEEADPASILQSDIQPDAATIQTLEVQEEDDGAGIALETDDGEEGVLAVLQDENGQQQTVRLTPDQAAALGINYSELVAAASAAASQPDDEVVGEEDALTLPAPDTEQESAQEVASLASSVMLDLNEKPSLVNHTVGGNRVTYTFEVVDDKGTGVGNKTASPAVSSDLLVKSRQIMVPQVRPDQPRPLQSSLKRSGVSSISSQVFKPTGPLSRPPFPSTSGSQSSASRMKKSPLYSTAGARAPGPSSRTGVTAAATTVQQSVAGAVTDEADLPVILTPMVGQTLPDYIEPRPGLKILVRPLDPADCGEAGPSAVGRPLGSSDNPIQLVQQGNTFKSLQPLSESQLKQIATVLQQSRLNIPANTKNTIYDSDTNTRIVYRVVYPEEARRPGVYRPRGRGAGSRGGRGVGRPRRIDTDMDSRDEDWSPGLEYSRDAKKRSTTKTRTGRVSKPPKYMVKDYRHIHRLDLNAPDMDDSDGGYSEWDYDDKDGKDKPTDKPADVEAGRPSAVPEKPPRVKRELAPAMKDRFGCRTCGAICIGYMRLEGHFRKNPTHERPPYIPAKQPPARKYKSARGRQSAAHASKRPRLDDLADPDAGVSDWGVDEVFGMMLELADGSMTKLLDTMTGCTQLLRHHVARRLRPTAAPEPGELPDATEPTVHLDADQAALCGLPAGSYLVEPDTTDVKPPPPPAVVADPAADGSAVDPDPTVAVGSSVGDVLDQFVDGLVNTAVYNFPVNATTADQPVTTPPSPFSPVGDGLPVITSVTGGSGDFTPVTTAVGGGFTPSITTAEDGIFTTSVTTAVDGVFTTSARAAVDGVFTPSIATADDGVFTTSVTTAIDRVFTSVSAGDSVFTPSVTTVDGVFTPSVTTVDGVFTPSVTTVDGVFTPSVTTVDGVFTTSVPAGEDGVFATSGRAAVDGVFQTSGAANEGGVFPTAEEDAVFTTPGRAEEDGELSPVDQLIDSALAATAAAAATEAAAVDRPAVQLPEDIVMTDVAEGAAQSMPLLEDR